MWPAATDALRTRIGWHAARRLVAARPVRARVAADRVRRVLVVLPPDADALRAAWAFVEALRAPVLLAVPSDSVAFVPDAFAGSVVRVGPHETDWRGLPRKAVLARLWPSDLDVAVSLAPPTSLVAAVLVGAGPVGLRVGVDTGAAAGGAAPFYDLALGAETADISRALLGRLAQIRPPVVPLAARLAAPLSAR